MTQTATGHWQHTGLYLGTTGPEEPSLSFQIVKEEPKKLVGQKLSNLEIARLIAKNAPYAYYKGGCIFAGYRHVIEEYTN